jgi:hypothetical protein
MDRRLALRAHFGEAFNTTMLAATILVVWGSVVALPVILLLR